MNAAKESAFLQDCLSHSHDVGHAAGVAAGDLAAGALVGKAVGQLAVGGGVPPSAPLLWLDAAGSLVSAPVVYQKTYDVIEPKAEHLWENGCKCIDNLRDKGQDFFDSPIRSTEDSGYFDGLPSESNELTSDADLQIANSTDILPTETSLDLISPTSLDSFSPEMDFSLQSF